VFAVTVSPARLYPDQCRTKNHNAFQSVTCKANASTRSST
jgi:hypothetical protein